MKKNKLFVLGFLLILIGIGIFTVNALNGNDKIETVSLLNNDAILVKYSKTENYENREMKIYLDDEENEYIFSNNKLTGFLKNVKIEEKEHSEIEKIMSNEDSKNEMLEKYKEKALEIITNYTKDKSILDRYDVTDSYYQEDYDELVYSFTKTIDGYVTNDSITISLDINGNLSSLSAPFQGLFDEYENVKIDRNEVDKFVKETMSSKNYNDVESYSVDYEFINIVNEKLVLEIGIKLEHETSGISTTVLYYEI